MVRGTTFQSIIAAVTASNDIRLALPEYERSIFEEGCRMGADQVRALVAQFVTDEEERRQIEETFAAVVSQRQGETASE